MTISFISKTVLGFLCLSVSPLLALENSPYAVGRYIENKPLSDASKRYVLTGGPGVGKTTIINYLEKLGHRVVPEAATDLILESLSRNIPAPWTNPNFSEKVAQLQEQRQKAVESITQTIFFDRSPVDAISYYFLSQSEPSLQTIEIVQSLLDAHFYNKTVFLIENLGICLQTEVRSETLEEALKIEAILEDTYRSLGFQIIRVPACSVEERVQKILDYIASH